MPSRGGAVERPAGVLNLRRTISLLVLVLLLLSAVRGAVSADPPAAVSRLSADEARSAGTAVAFNRQLSAAGPLLEVRGPLSAPGMKLLAVAPDGQAAAVSGLPGGDLDYLALVRSDGSQLRIRLAGVHSAAFAPAGDHLLAVDGAGALWQVDATTGDPQRLAEGPFAGTPVSESDGSVLLLAVSSVEAPFVSQLVRLDAAHANLEPLSDAQLVYGAFVLADGSIAIVVHQPGGTVVRRISVDGETVLADLGPDAVHVAVSATGLIAFERQGNDVQIMGGNDSEPRRLASGANPVFAPDGSALLVWQPGGALLIDVEGNVIARLGPLAAFIPCPTGCAS